MRKKYECCFRLRLTESDRVLLEQQAKQQNRSAADVVRSLIRTGQLPKNQTSTSAILRELSRVGNNLNQLARVANTTGQIEQVNELTEEIEELKKIFLSIQEYYRE